MCRITAILSVNPAANEDVLCAGPKSLLAQAGAVSGRYQDDGWGVGCFRGGKPAVKKSPGPARLETAAFRAAARSAVSRVTLAHLREASNPSGLPRASLIGMANTQPFAAGGFLFAHNGTLFIKDEIRSLLGAYAGKVKGGNDSEVLFWQAVKMLDAYGEPAMALRMALDEILTVWVSCRDKYPGKKAPYLGLNLFLASADSLTVLCHGGRQKGKGKPALLTPGWEGSRIAWRQERSRAVFSSEPADDKPGWKKMDDPSVASARLQGGAIKIGFERITL
jgi:glutamine amidotransferase